MVIFKKMNYQKQKISKALFLAAILAALNLNALGNNTFQVILDLNECKNHTLHVKIFTPKIPLEVVKFILPSNVPGAIAEIKTGKLVSNFVALDSIGNQLKYFRVSVNEFEIVSGGKVASIEYDIHDSWHYSEPNILLPQIGTSFVQGKHFVLNMHAIAGYILGYENNPFKLSISKPKQLFYSGSLSVIQTAKADQINLPGGYLELIDNPILYSNEPESSFIINGTKFKIGFYSEDSSIKKEQIIKTLKSVCEAASFFCEGFNKKQYSFLFNYVLAESDPFKSEEIYGAIEHSNSSLYYFPISDNQYKIERDILYTAAHELMHLYGPLMLQTDQTNKLNLRAKNQSSNLWMYEGFTEYLSLLMLYQQELITETEFINEIRNKINLSNYAENFALEKASKLCFLEGNQEMYKSFYNKGAVTAMMLDLRLIKLSKGKLNLKLLLNDLLTASRSNYVLKDEGLIDELAKYSYPDIKDFLEKHVKDTIRIDYNAELSTIGWKYESAKMDTSKMYVNAIYRYSKSNKEFFLANISLDQIGFNEGDVLLKINGKKVTKENLNDLLDKFSSLQYNKQVVFEVKRNNKIIELSGPPLIINKNQKNLISIERKVDVQKKELRKFFKSENAKNYPYKTFN
jgi:predicted metalloprotease with PDZ domain